MLAPALAYVTFRFLTGPLLRPLLQRRDWPAIVEANRERVLAAADPAEFEAAVHRVVVSLGTSHTGFFHDSLRRVPGRLAIGVRQRAVASGHGQIAEQRVRILAQADQPFLTKPISDSRGSRSGIPDEADH